MSDLTGSAQPPHPRHPLRELIWPVYVPSVIYASGTSALLPAQIVVALQLGFDAAQVALLATWVGAFAVLASFVSGYLIAWWGERRALGVSTVATSAALAALVVALVLGWAGAPALLVVAMTVVDLGDAVWSIARQGLVADHSPAHLRGRAMNLYGASQRAGRVVGPLIAAGAMVLAGPAMVFVAAIVLLAAAYGVLVARLPARGATPAANAATATGPQQGRPAAIRALFLLGAGVLVLAALRTGKETLIPLWGVDGLGLDGAQVALIMGVASGMELLLFWPAGLAMDRLGRAPVVVGALGCMGVGLILMPLGSATGWFVGTAMVVGLGDGIGAGIIKTLGVDIAPQQARARFLGWWQSVASVGSLLAPALAGAIIAVASLGAALPVLGALGVAGAAWMAAWTPRLVPRPGPVRGPGQAEGPGRGQRQPRAERAEAAPDPASGTASR